MIKEETPFWFCEECRKKVLVLNATDIGIYCRECGNRVKIPKGVEDTPLFWDDEDDTFHEEDIDIQFITGAF